MHRGSRQRYVLVVDQLAPVDPAEAASVHAFETARDPSHCRLLPDAELRELFAANGLDPIRERREEERRELGDYLDRAGCEGDRRGGVEELAAADPRVLVARVGWYLLVSDADGAALEGRERVT